MQYRSEIDGLRAIAVVPVILFHAGFDAFAGGFVGVDVFFVISGYLITSIIIADLNKGSFSLLDFYERRARRILPALFFVMLACLPFAWLWLMPPDLLDFVHSLLAAVFFSSNILFWTTSGYFETAAELKPLLHTWSLAVEEQYYLLFPLCMMFLWRFGIRLVATTLCVFFLISLSYAQWAVSNSPDAAFYLLPARGWELLLGAGTALFISKRGMLKGSAAAQILSLAGLLLIGISIVIFDHQTPFPGLYATIPTVGTALIILFAVDGTWVKRLLGAKPLVGMGLISYSAYLWHQPVLAFARHRSLVEPSDLLLLLLCLSVVPLAYLTWRFVEQPFRDRQRIESRSIVPAVSAAVVVTFSIVAATHISNGFAARMDNQVLKLVSFYDEYASRRKSDTCNVIDDDIELAGCINGGKGPADFALIGDSHAAALEKTLSVAFNDIGKSYIQYTKNGCPLAFGFNNKRNQRCGDFLSNVAKDLKERNTQNLIIAARWSAYILQGNIDNEVGGIEVRPDYGYTIAPLPSSAPFDARVDAIIAAYEEAILTFAKQGKRVFLLGPTPEPGWDVPLQMARSGHFTGDIELPPMPVSAYRKRNDTVDKLFVRLAQNQNITYVNMQEILCETDTKSCPLSANGVPYYFDSDHVSDSGAKKIVERLIKEITNP